MTVQHSFSKIEKELLPAFRQQISTAESTEEVKKFFIHTIQDLLHRATEGELKPLYEDVFLNPVTVEDDCQFRFSDKLKADTAFSTIWLDSDLQHIVGRFAGAACNRYTHLGKNPEKTEAKIRM